MALINTNCNYCFLLCKNIQSFAKLWELVFEHSIPLNVKQFCQASKLNFAENFLIKLGTPRPKRLPTHSINSYKKKTFIRLEFGVKSKLLKSCFRSIH
jgi:hypothetical protein